jgi:hypothetical protein
VNKQRKGCRSVWTVCSLHYCRVAHYRIRFWLTGLQTSISPDSLSYFIDHQLFGSQFKQSVTVKWKRITSCLNFKIASLRAVTKWNISVSNKWDCVCGALLDHGNCRCNFMNMLGTFAKAKLLHSRPILTRSASKWLVVRQQNDRIFYGLLNFLQFMGVRRRVHVCICSLCACACVCVCVSYFGYHSIAVQSVIATCTCWCVVGGCPLILISVGALANLTCLCFQSHVVSPSQRGGSNLKFPSTSFELIIHNHHVITHWTRYILYV